MNPYTGSIFLYFYYINISLSLIYKGTTMRVREKSEKKQKNQASARFSAARRAKVQTVLSSQPSSSAIAQ
jgi:hypothetical protein